MGKRIAKKKSDAAAAKADEKARQKWNASLAPRFTKSLLSKPTALACTRSLTGPLATDTPSWCPWPEQNKVDFRSMLRRSNMACR